MKKKINFQVNPLLSGPSLSQRTRAGIPYREIQLSEIDIDPNQPRRVFETEALAELAASIKEHGVLCPILVRLTEGGTYRLIAGERRLRASKLAGIETIPAVISTEEEEGAPILAKQLVENLQRQDLTPMERALAIGQLRDLNRWSVREIARRLGISKSLTQRSLEILNLPEDLQAALIAGASESKVVLLSQVTNRDAREQLLRRLDKLTREELQAEVERLSGQNDELSHRGTKGGKEESAKVRRRPEDESLINELQRSLGTKVRLERKSTNESQGRVIVEFYSGDDLTEIFKRLTSESRDVQ